MRKRLSFGPGTLVAAAFIGPGTVTTATVAGVDYGMALLWALVFSTLATIVLQEMSLRVGLIGGMGLGQAIRARMTHPRLRVGTAALVLGAILVGNAAYQTGNVLGGALGLSELVGGDLRAWGPLLGAIAFALLWTGRYRLVERVLVGAVILMGIVFLVTGLALRPSLSELASGLVPRALPDRRALLLALGLVGTTVVPYNLFLHASAVCERWQGEDDLQSARVDSALSVGLGGLISIAILVAAAALPAAARVTSAADMAPALEPLLGRWASAFFATGLLAAGLSSAITAPLAAAYATCGVLGWNADLKGKASRTVWGSVLAVGVVLSALAMRPIPAIVFAQAANGVLLPVVAVLLLVMANDRGLLGRHRNGPLSNVSAVAVVLIAALLGARSLFLALGVL